ncbi:MAG TPA: dipeptide/oligopeptide/nickel ABC transporter ATP-binding protein [Vicinamibacterales bacterium]|nr:dipeptide/oligopeptide/nickel ABC transporter ATP-binding protein [Vicinamibacterales bacterium]HOQ61688.1 dipeptide/oligopeptide/nickel ABC transporter ATP-binding protein [Vicinamibacterales bacterium]HPK71962.1 dipeptide/oligopeptide/nickel ABC transporter ATP-binding protein [Vicinamibacterales bacterium]
MAMVEVRGLEKHFVRRAAPWGRPTRVTAVDGFDLSIEEGEIVGLIGESGSGKTTAGRCLLRLVEPSAGSFAFRGEDVFAMSPARLRQARRQMQMVFQDPESSLDPRMRAGAIVEEGLVIHGLGTPAERRGRVREMLELVGLDANRADRYPHEFSGGERQRLGLARALALAPSFLVADEPVSSLDLSIQAQIVNLFMDLQQQLGLTLLFITHDLRLVRHLCSRVVVMHRGRTVGAGPAADVDRLWGQISTGEPAGSDLEFRSPPGRRAAEFEV